MNIVGTVSSVLSQKARPTEIWTISPDVTVFEAIRKLAEKNVGVLLVMTGDQLVGIFSERDYTRKVALHGKSSRQMLVREIISTTIIHVTPAHAIEECMRLMTVNRIRHLPVVEGGKVVGVVSIGDLVNWIISTQTQFIRQMEGYIHGQY